MPFLGLFQKNSLKTLIIAVQCTLTKMTYDQQNKKISEEILNKYFQRKCIFETCRNVVIYGLIWCILEAVNNLYTEKQYLIT